MRRIYVRNWRQHRARRHSGSSHQQAAIAGVAIQMGPIAEIALGAAQHGLSLRLVSAWSTVLVSAAMIRKAAGTSIQQVNTAPSARTTKQLTSRCEFESVGDGDHAAGRWSAMTVVDRRYCASPGPTARASPFPTLGTLELAGVAHPRSLARSCAASDHAAGHSRSSLCATRCTYLHVGPELVLKLFNSSVDA